MSLKLLRRACIFALVALSLLSARSAFTSTEAEVGAGARNAGSSAVLSAQRFPGVLASAASETSTRNAITAALTPLGSNWCGVAAAGATTIYDVRRDMALVPASTVKILTGAAAIDEFGSDHTFETKVVGSKPNNGQIDGAIALVGGGDPLLMSAAYAESIDNSTDVHTPLEALADRVVQSGVRSVSGGVVVDDSLFDSQRAVTDWQPGYISQAQVGSIGAAVVDQGITTDDGRRVVDDPRSHAASVLASMLRARGVQVGAPPPGAGSKVGSDTLATIESRSLGDIVGQMLTESDNTTAEMLLKNLSAQTSDEPGSTRDGTARVLDYLRGLGVDTSGLAITDGSGLARSNRVTCSALQAVLGSSGLDSPVGNGLARAGQSGTLDTRMNGSIAEGRVQAKTGTLDQVSALAGWARPDGHPPVAFSIVVNGVETSRAEAAQDAVATALAALPQTPPEDAYAPG